MVLFSIILHENLLNRMISLYCRENLPLFFIWTLKILKTLMILFWYWFSVSVELRFGKKSELRFRSGFCEIPFQESFTNQEPPTNNFLSSDEVVLYVSRTIRGDYSPRMQNPSFASALGIVTRSVLKEYYIARSTKYKETEAQRPKPKVQSPKTEARSPKTKAWSPKPEAQNPY